MVNDKYRADKGVHFNIEALLRTKGAYKLLLEIDEIICTPGLTDQDKAEIIKASVVLLIKGEHGDVE